MTRILQIFRHKKTLGTIDRFLNSAAPITVALMFSKILTREQFGLYSLAMSLFMTLAFFESFFQTATIRYCATKNPERFTEVVSSLLYWKLAALVVAWLLVLLVGVPVARLYKQEALLAIFRWFPIMFLAFTLESHFVSIIRAKQDIQELVRQDAIFAAAYVGLSLLLVRRVHTAEQMFIVYLVAFLPNLIYLTARFPEFLKISHGMFRPVAAEIFHYGKYTALVGLGALAYQNFDVMMIGYLRSIEDVGVYRLGRIAANLVVIVTQGILLTLMPQISTLHEEGRHTQIKAVYDRHVRLLLQVFIPFFLLSLAFAGPLFDWYFAGKYRGAEIIFSIFAFTGIIKAFENPQGALLAGVGLIHLDSVQMWASVAVNIILNLLLIPRWGFIGAALATNVTLLSGALLKQHFIRKHYYAKVGTYSVASA